MKIDTAEYLQPERMYFDLLNGISCWKIFTNIGRRQFSVELLPSVFATFESTGLKRMVKAHLVEEYQLGSVSLEREKVQNQLVSLASVLEPRF